MWDMTVREHLLSILPKASKENPKSLELAQEVIDNTDSITAKYAPWYGLISDINGLYPYAITEHVFVCFVSTETLLTIA